jgi:hypothetical protein
MASLMKRKGHWIIQVTVKRARRTVRLGKISAGEAKDIHRRVESLASSDVARLGPTKELAKWLGELDHRMRVKLAAAGLIAEESIASHDAGPGTKHRAETRGGGQGFLLGGG